MRKLFLLLIFGTMFGSEEEGEQIARVDPDGRFFQLLGGFSIRDALRHGSMLPAPDGRGITDWRNKGLTSCDGIQTVHSEKTIQLLLAGNNLTQIPPNLGGAHMPNLTLLDLDDNPIQSIAQNALENFPSLGCLSLKNNRLRTITSATMHPLKQLRWLSLRSDQATRFEAGCLAGLIHLKTLLLSSEHVMDHCERSTASPTVLDNARITIDESAEPPKRTTFTYAARTICICCFKRDGLRDGLDRTIDPAALLMFLSHCFAPSR